MNSTLFLTGFGIYVLFLFGSAGLFHVIKNQEKIFY